MKPVSAITIERLGKRYRVPSTDRAEYRLLSENVAQLVTAPWRWLRRSARGARHDWFWALEDLDFEVTHGEVVGVIGRNGAGKSTLLKILSRITKPTRGEVCLQGRVGSLLEVGTGFHPELTGRENIYLNGGILGMRRREIRRHFDAIVEFAGVQRFLDMPVKRYSSGMRVRLAFAVAAHLEPEILLIDEVLAVGDLAFQQKCLARMGQVAADGRTVLFVSHNMPAIESLCGRSILLSAGKKDADGPTHEVVTRFVQTMLAQNQGCNRARVDLSDHANRRQGSHRLLRSLSIRNQLGRTVSELALGSTVQFHIAFENPDNRRELGFAVFLCSESGQRLAMLHSRIHSRLSGAEAGVDQVRCVLPELPLLPGNYRIDVAVGTWDELLDYVEHATTLTVLPSDYLGTGELPNHQQGVLALKCDWSWHTEHAVPRPMSTLDAAAFDAASLTSLDGSS